MEENPHSTLKSSLEKISVKALNCSGRLILANNLDSKQVLPSEKGFARDYRGLAELIGFQYHEIKKFEEFNDRTMKIVESWETKPDATLDKLINYLEDMDRYDIIKELIPSLEKNVKAYLEYQRTLENPIQVAEVTSGPINVHYSKRSALTRDDKISGENTIYDAYVSYADEDSHIAKQFANVLESPKVRLKLFIRGRDMLAGCPELDTDIELIKNRCRHMLILLTPNFIKSPALEFQVSFAGSLAIEQKQRILIPVILTPCEIPPILNSVSKIDFTKEYTHDWMWDKLITSLLPEDNTAIFLSSLARSPVRSRNILPSSASPLSISSASPLPISSASPLSISSASPLPIEDGPVITFPQSAKHSLICENDPSTGVILTSPADTPNDDNKDSGICSEIKFVCSEMKDPGVYSEIKIPVASPESKETVSSPPKAGSSKKLDKIMSFFKGKGPSTSASSSFPSGATSGFHSQSCSNIKSLENSNVHYTNDTSL